MMCTSGVLTGSFGCFPLLLRISSCSSLCSLCSLCCCCCCCCCFRFRFRCHFVCWCRCRCRCRCSSLGIFLLQLFSFICPLVPPLLRLLLLLRKSSLRYFEL